MAQLIASDTITVPSEEKVFESVISWINFNTDERSGHLPQLLEHVRLPLLSQEYLLNRVESEPLLKTNDNCKDFIIEAMKFHLLKGDLKLSMSLTSPRTKPRQPIGLPKVMLAIGGQAPKAIRSVECYDFKVRGIESKSSENQRHKGYISGRPMVPLVRDARQTLQVRRDCGQRPSIRGWRIQRQPPGEDSGHV